MQRRVHSDDHPHLPGLLRSPESGTQVATAKIEQALSKLEEGNRCIAAVVRRIFAGARPAADLTADLDPNSAAFVGRILKSITGR